MKRFALLTSLLFSVMTAALAAEKSPFVGRWALTIPGGAAGWLGVTETNGTLAASVLWGGGSVLPVTTTRVEGDTLVLTRESVLRRTDAKGHTTTNRVVETIRAKVAADQLNLMREVDDPDLGSDIAAFTGQRIPPLPARPDLSKVKFGDPIKLFNGENLDGWKLVEPNSVNGWFVKDGVLSNDPKQTPGERHKNYGNLRTVREFEDFNLKLETNVPQNGNSGVYLRGIYEVQVMDSYGKKLDSHNMGAIYSRITPSESAEKPVGEWQTLDITLVDRHATVILNGKKIIDNQPLLGCTGGALWSDQLRPGPIYLQGDHTGANYRNVVLRPVVK